MNSLISSFLLILEANSIEICIDNDGLNMLQSEKQQKLSNAFFEIRLDVPNARLYHIPSSPWKRFISVLVHAVETSANHIKMILL